MTSKSKAKPAVAGVAALAILITAWFVKPWEGDAPTGYRDIVNVATACYGHTGRDVVVGKTYSRQQCQDWLESDVGIAVEGADRCVTTPLKANQLAAFGSLAFNIGVAQFCRSSIARLANAGDLVGACKAIGLYVYAGGRKVQGLVNRRRGEIALCLDVPTQQAPLP